jgi:hypothetical protein
LGTGESLREREAGEVTMWGIRVIRVGVLLSGLLATITGAGCECCQNLWGTKSAPKNETKESNNKPGEWDPVSGHFNDVPGHLTPERVHGGIY